jgi:hypothetical protein
VPSLVVGLVCALPQCETVDATSCQGISSNPSAITYAAGTALDRDGEVDGKPSATPAQLGRQRWLAPFVPRTGWSIGERQWCVLAGVVEKM